MHASYPRQTYFDMPIHEFLVFWYFNKTYFGIYRQKHENIYVSCILDLSYATCLNVFKYHVFAFK